MCGIAGWYRRGGRPVSIEVIALQCDRIRHRGPDDAGCMVDGDFGFGMRRLSIIDIEGGHQPLSTQGGRYSVVFNGEIVKSSSTCGANWSHASASARRAIPKPCSPASFAGGT